MKDKQVIENLRLLRSVKPDEKTVRFIYKKSTAQLFGKKRDASHGWFKNATLIPIATFAVLVITFSLGTIFLPTVINKAIVSTETTFIPNHYDKAKIAVANAEGQFVSFEQKPNDTKILDKFSQLLALANIQMTKLQLKGEKGKYTMQDCLTLYFSYHKSLSLMGKTINSQSNLSNEDKQILKQIKEYDEQAEKKLHMYNR